MFSTIPLLFEENLEHYIGIAEIFSEMGFLLGPILGSILYSLGGYILPFYFFGTISILFVPILYIIIKRVNNTL
jgi:hypothetical protein